MHLTERLLRYLIRGMQGFVTMIEDMPDLMDAMDSGTRQNFVHWRERLNRLKFKEERQDASQANQQVGPTNKQKRRNLNPGG